MHKKSMVKLSLFTLIVAFMAFGTIAIAKTVIMNENPAPKTVMTDIWYFQGGNPELADSYSKIPVTGKPCGLAEETICQILAPEDGSTAHPDLNANAGSKTVLQHIKDAVSSIPGTPTPNDAVTSFRAL